MIRIRANGDEAPLRDVEITTSAASAGKVSDPPKTPIATAHALGAGKKVLLFGRLVPDEMQAQASAKRRWPRRSRLDKTPDWHSTLRVRLSPRGRWRPIEVRPDGTWLTLIDLQTRRLAAHGQAVCLKLETPEGSVEQRVPLAPWPSSATRLVICGMDVVRAECSDGPSEVVGPSCSDLSRLLHALRSPAGCETASGQPSGVLVYLSESLAALEQDRLLLRDRRLPDGWLLPFDIEDSENGATNFPVVLLQALEKLLPRKVRLVLLTHSVVSTDLRSAHCAGPEFNRLEVILQWSKTDHSAGRTQPLEENAADGQEEDARILLVENASRANRILSQRGLLASPSLESTAAARRRRTRTRTTRYPLVLCHGLLAYSTLALERCSLDDYFLGVRQHLEEYGFTVWTPEVGRTHGIRNRAVQLRDAITRQTSGPVNLIGHSMGGLDARWMISQLDMADRVPVLVTIATPHRGSSFANWFLERAERRLPVLPLLEALGADMNGYRDVTPKACRRFNEVAPDAEGVTYYAYTASTSRQRVSPMLRQGHGVISRHEGPNDGMVSVASAARGTVLGHLSTDHFCQIGHGHFQSEFDHLGFFLRLASELARQGF